MATKRRKLQIFGTFLAGLVVILLLIVQVVMKNQLSTVLIGAIPDAEARYKVGIDLGDASVNVFGRKASLSSLVIRNPEGYDEDLMCGVGSFDASFRLFPLIFGGTADFKKMEAKGLDVSVIRNKQSAININHLSQAISGKDVIKMSTVSDIVADLPIPTGQPVIAKKVSAESATSVKSAKSDDRPTRIDSLKMSGRFNYVDHYIYPEMRAMGIAVDEDVFRLSLDLDITGSGLNWFRDADRWGKLTVKGHLADDPERYRIELNTEMAPMTDPDHVNMRLRGAIENIDLDALGPYTERYGFNCDPVRIEINAVCRDGYYDPRESTVTYYVSNIRMSEELAKEMSAKTGGFMAFPEKIELPVPLKGPYNSPELDMGSVDWASVLMKSLPIGDLLGQGLKILSEGADDGESSGDAQEALEGLLKDFLGSGGGEE